MNIDTDDCTVRLADARSALTQLNGALHPTPAATQERLDAVKADIAKHAAKSTSLDDVDTMATTKVETELFERIASRADAAKRALDFARVRVQANVNGLDAVPDFRPEWERGRTDTAYQVECLRAELNLRDVRADWRDRPVPEQVNAYAAAHREQNWLQAEALHRELEHQLRDLPGTGGMGDADALIERRERIQRALDEGRAARRQLVDANVKAKVLSDAEQFAHLDSEWQKHALLLHELRARKRYPLTELGR